MTNAEQTAIKAQVWSLLCPTTGLIYQARLDRLYDLEAQAGVVVAAVRCAHCDAAMRPAWEPGHDASNPQLHYYTQIDGAFVLARGEREVTV